jgi:hypothetical protein
MPVIYSSFSAFIFGISFSYTTKENFQEVLSIFPSPSLVHSLSLLLKHILSAPFQSKVNKKFLNNRREEKKASKQNNDKSDFIPFFRSVVQKKETSKNRDSLIPTRLDEQTSRSLFLPAQCFLLLQIALEMEEILCISYLISRGLMGSQFWDSFVITSPISVYL